MTFLSEKLKSHFYSNGLLYLLFIDEIIPILVSKRASWYKCLTLNQLNFIH